MKIGEKIDSIQVVLLAGLTEVLLALPALRALRAHFSRARISVLTSPGGSELLGSVNWIDEAIGIGRLRKGEIFDLRTGYRTLRSIERLRQYSREGLRPDLLVDLSGGIGSTLLRELIGSGSAVVGRQGGLLPGIFDPLQIDCAQLHRSHYYLRCLEPLGVRPVIAAPELSTLPAADERIERLLRRLGIESGHLLIGLHPGQGLGAGEDGWPIDRFAALGRRLISQFNARLIIMCGRGEEQRRRRLADALPRQETIPIDRLPLIDYLSLLARLSLLIGNAGAVPHLGSAVGTPVVAVSLSSRATPFEIISQSGITIRAPHFDQPDLQNEEAVFQAACQLLVLNRSRLLRDH